MPHTKTTHEFIRDARLKHGSKYDYSKTVYFNSKKPVVIICPKHGEFARTPNAHLRGTGCRQCYEEEFQWSRDDFIKAATDVHGGKYDYTNVVFTNITTRIDIFCNECEKVFSQLPCNHLYGKGRNGKGHGCPNCKQKGDRNPAWNPNRTAVSLNKMIHGKVKSMLTHTLNATNQTKNSKTALILGYSRKHLLEHLMSHPNWSRCNEHDLQIDHIFPVKAFTDHGITNLKIINALENLQPLPARDNAAKNDTYDPVLFQKWLDMKIMEVGEDEVYKSHELIIEAANQAMPPSSRYKGVKKSNDHEQRKGKSGAKIWYASIYHDGQHEHLGFFETEKEAAHQYDYFYLKYRGVAPNFPDFDYSNYSPVPHGLQFAPARGKSKYKGVKWYQPRDRGYWTATITINGKRHNLGYFDVEQEAALNYDFHAKRIHGECYLNFPDHDFSSFTPRKTLLC